MDQYQYNVSLNGHFLFRTDWDDDKKRVEKVGIELGKRFPSLGGFVVMLNARNVTVTSGRLAN